MREGSRDRDSQEKGSMDANNFSDDDRSNSFEFAFNSSNFSDRLLRIEIVDGASGSRSGGEDCYSLARWNRKRKRKEIKSGKAAEFDVFNSDNIVNLIQPNAGDDITFDLHEESVAMVQSPSGDEYYDGTGDEPLAGSGSSGMDSSPVTRVKSVFINSAILAAKSSFFYKLFSNGMRESDQRHVTLRINASEEAALMGLLRFMYCGKLSINSPSFVLDVLVAADKFEVASCTRYCSQLLQSIPMTTEFALLYLELPSSVSLASALQPLVDAAKEFITNKYRMISKFVDELMNFPLSAMEAILSSDKLIVISEDVVYNIVIKWARTRYPVLDDRREILRARLGPLIRFPFMTYRTLRKVLISSDLDHEFASKAVLDALFFKAETPSPGRDLASEDHYMVNSKCRIYKCHPVKAVELELPHPQCIVFFDLEKRECAHLFPRRFVYSERFHLCSDWLFLMMQCSNNGETSPYLLKLFLGLVEGSTASTFDYEVAARILPMMDFVSQHNGYNTTVRKGKLHLLFETLWKSYIADNSPYFFNGMFHLRVVLTVKPPPQQEQQPQPQ